MRSVQVEFGERKILTGFFEHWTKQVDPTGCGTKDYFLKEEEKESCRQQLHLVDTPAWKHALFLLRQYASDGLGNNLIVGDHAHLLQGFPE